jgi:hypothetical protein
MNSNLFKTSSTLPLILINKNDSLNNINFYDGYLLKSKSVVTSLLQEFRELHSNLILEDWSGSINNLQFNKLKFNVSHLNYVHAGLTVGLSGLKLFLPKGHR